MKPEIKYVFSDNTELDDWVETVRIGKAARRVLSEIRDELRTQVKYGEHKFPENKSAVEAADDRDSFWYSRLFELSSDEDVDLWEV